MRHKISNWGIILLFSLILWSGFTVPANASSERLSADRRHILERLSFGITSQQLEQVNRGGIESYIESQLNPQLVSESQVLSDYLAQLKSIPQDPIESQKKVRRWRKELKEQTPELTNEQVRQRRKEIRQFENRIRDETISAQLARAMYSNRQLQEVMVDFWFNHFNIFANKGASKLWLGDYEDRIRTHALGNFRELLGMTAKHPAMLIYLDNRINTASDSLAGKRTKQGLNENYARELMELHTLGVDGGYTQDDVIALARIFTGWGIDILGKHGDSGFFFYKNRHDRQEKTFLGHQIASNGIEEGEQALNILASHPATAHFISYKLAQYFVADLPPTSLVDKLSQEFIASEGNIKRVMDTLIHSEEFNDPQYYKQKFKTPYQYLVSLVRMAEIEQPNFKRIKGMLTQLSMPLYLCAAPTGYKNTQDAWLNPQAMLQRTSMATAIANRALNRDYSIKQQRLNRNFGELSSNTKQVVAKTPSKLRSALVLGSPEAMYR